LAAQGEAPNERGVAGAAACDDDKEAAATALRDGAAAPPPPGAFAAAASLGDFRARLRAPAEREMFVPAATDTAAPPFRANVRSTEVSGDGTA